MSGLIRKSAVATTCAALAVGGMASPAAAAHHKTWSAAKCKKQLAHFQKSHKHPSQKQISREEKRLAKHNCPPS